MLQLQSPQLSPELLLALKTTVNEDTFTYFSLSLTHTNTHIFVFSTFGDV